MPLKMMNLTSSANLPADILFVNFNQDSSSVAVGTRLGYRLFNLGSVDKLEQIHESQNESLDVCLVERLFLSSLIAQVSLSSPRKLKVCHFRKGVEICDYSYSNTILAVKMNRIRLIVILEDSVYIHDISDMRVLHIIDDTPANTHGVCDLSSSNDNSLFAYPGSRGSGDVLIFDAANLKAVTTIQAHNSAIAAMKFNRDASLLATASDKGTIIRVFAIPSGQKMFEFRRGMKRCVAISSIAFSNDSQFLAASSNTETVHIFKLTPTQNTSMEDQNNNNSVSGESWMDYVSEMWKKSSTYIPTQVTSMISQDRAFATVRLPFSGLKNVCTLAVIKKLLRVVIASEDGYLYIYNLDPEVGGECNFVRQHRLDSQGTVVTQPQKISTYASATKGSNTNNNTKIRSGSVEICSSGSSAEYVEKDAKLLPKGKLKNLVDEHELVEDLPLDDDQEFPPMNMFVE